MTKEEVYIGDKKVVSTFPTDKTTPGGDKIIGVKFENNSEEEMSERRFSIVRTYKPSDASSVREVFCKHVASQIYGILHEYDVRISEIDYTMAQLDSLLGGASTMVENILWGVEDQESRTLNMMNQILLENGKTVDNNGTSPKGDKPDSKD